jgi:plasmid stabilization system protein ParE
MVKRIVWTSNADRIFKKILEYYIDRNKSKTYSRKLNNEIHSLLKVLLKQPFLGLKTDDKNIRVFIHDNYKIFYQSDHDKLIIHFIWDCRQNPETIAL